MHAQHFSVEWAGDAVIVTFHGQRLQDENVEAMRADLLHALAAPRKVALSLGNVEFLASAALGLIAQIGRKVSSQGGRVVLCGVRPDVARLFSGPPYLTRDLPLFSDRDAALHALANGDSRS